MERFAEPGTAGVVFVGPQGGRLRRQHFRREWVKALSATGVRYVHFHDFRHTGNTLAAATGASLRELMIRMGHASPRAALIYQHATNDRDRLIADAMSDQIAAGCNPSTGPDESVPPAASGT
jgi:integrase